MCALIKFNYLFKLRRIEQFNYDCKVIHKILILENAKNIELCTRQIHLYNNTVRSNLLDIIIN